MTTRAERIRGGDARAAALLMRDLDDREPSALATLKALYAHAGRAYVIGVTGNPGAGKSTLVDQLVAHYRAAGERVGVIAIDPTSPVSGGAILGDRIRMQRHATDPGVFIRSVATRGQLGGLSRSTLELAVVLDAMGFDRVIVETVGVGQDELDVIALAHTTVVVCVPGLGDDIQAIKAGILEVADVLVVNKADREGAARTERDLQLMLRMRPDGDATAVVRTIGTSGQGIGELATAIAAHRDRAWTGAAGTTRTQVRSARQLAELVRALLTDRVERLLAGTDGLAEAAAGVAAGRSDPWTAAEALLSKLPP